MANPRFLDGDMSTYFIAEEYPDGFMPAPLDKGQIDNIIAVGALMHMRYMHRATRTIGVMPGFERTIPSELVVVIGGEHYPVVAEPIANRPEEGFNINLGTRRTFAIRSDWRIGDPVLKCNIARVPQRFGVERRGLGYRLFHLGSEIDVVVYRQRIAELAKIVPERKPRDMSRFVQSPMPGMLKSVAVEPGDRVGPDTEIAVVEAMKMENVLRSIRFGRVAKLHAKPGDTLAMGQIIAEFE
jgi:propionyl-CoA carboxylase alpha chain